MDGGGNQDDWVEHFADGITNPVEGQRQGGTSQDTLIEDEDEDDDDEEMPNYWFRVRRRFREPFAEYVDVHLTASGQN